MIRQIIRTSDAPGSPLFSQAIKAGNAVYMSGIVGIDPKTNQPVKQWKGKGGDGLRFGLGSLWLSNGALGTVWQLSPDQK